MTEDVKKANDRPMFLKPGHNAGDLVESHKWKVLREELGMVEVDVHLPDHLLNPRNQLFGGFTGVYVDMVSIYAIPTGHQRYGPALKTLVDH